MFFAWQKNGAWQDLPNYTDFKFNLRFVEKLYVNISALAERALHDGAIVQSLHIAEREWSNVSSSGGQMKHGFAV